MACRDVLVSYEKKKIYMRTVKGEELKEDKF